MSNELETKWYTLDPDEVITQLESDRNGLGDDQVTKRLEFYGENIITSEDPISVLSLLIDQFKNFLIILLLAAVLISIIIGHVIDGIAILIIVIFSIALGFIQEYRADKAIEALLKLTAPIAHVTRNGEQIPIPSREIVPGDIISLKMGDKIPADSRIIETINLQADEASLTGESHPVIKFSSRIDIEELQIADRKNMVYAGTVVTYGKGTAIVTNTGMNTEFGKIATQLSAIKTSQTPLQKNIDHMGKLLSLVSIAVIFIVFIIGIINNHDPVDMFIWSIALAVAVVPEALPAVITISLAVGVQRMSKKNALIRKLPAVETLGATSIILSDKTGTLTEGKMAVKETIAGTQSIVDFKGDIEDNLFLQGMFLCNDATFDNGEYFGNPTDIGLIKYSLKYGFDNNYLLNHSRIFEVPFSSDRKMMTTAHEYPNDVVQFTKGAPEKIIARCNYILENGKITKLDKSAITSINGIIDEMARKSLRTIAFAYKSVDKHDPITEDHMTFLGLVGLIDPPRIEVKDSVRECEEAGIKVIMITGDHLLTAKAIGKEIGIVKDGKVLTGIELDKIPDDELGAMIDDIDAVARVNPMHKLRMVEVIKKKGQIVAMTGDGINDAPALKSANVGVAMGITGTDVSKEASDMVLADDNFSSIVSAIYEGRIMFNNIKKYLMFLLSSNLGEILLLSSAVILALEFPLLAIQILYVNLATDGLPALALAIDPPTSKKLEGQPRDPHKNIFSTPVVKLLVLGGVWSFVVNFSIYYYFYYVLGHDLARTQSIVFVNLVIIQFVKSFIYRSEKDSIMKYRPFSNKWLNRAILWEMTLLILIIYLPAAQTIMGTHAFSFFEWILIIVSSLSVLPVLEFGKWFLVRRNLKEHPEYVT